MIARRRLGEILVAAGRITESQLEAALEESRNSGRRLGEVLVASRLIGFDDLGRAIAEQFEVPYEPMCDTTPTPEALEMVPANTASGFHLFPLKLDEHAFVVAMCNPDDLEAQDWLQARTGKPLDVRYALPERIERAISYYYGVGGGCPEAAEADAAPVEEDSDGFSVESMRKAGQEAPVIRLVNDILAECVQAGASDIHFEPRRTGLEVRMRVDGVMRRMRQLPKALRPAIISRLKLMADIDITERRKAQDGRISIRLSQHRVDIRVNTLPTRWGERTVLRLLDQEAGPRPLSELGMTPEIEQAFRAALAHPHGLILVTGPTGSGKTTTLYSALRELNDESINILTCEDPIEYELEGIGQSQVNEKVGLTFSAQLRAALRQDPDVVLVGEIRDLETAEVAARAAMTGHLVLSTLHTNDAPSAIPRLIDMEVPPYLINSALIAATAQRLLRRLCKECRVERAVSPEEAAELGLPSGATIWDAKGCSTCMNSGYRGRVGVHEVLTMNDDIRALTLRRASGADIRLAAVRSGMVTMQEDIRRKLMAGETSPAEAGRFLLAHTEETETEELAA
ncbi:MAG: Flp pilus assembly complex ATPase component TadA [Fimbriimonadia bacterium]|jgi:type IV pilus assembly protein PilB